VDGRSLDSKGETGPASLHPAAGDLEPAPRPDSPSTPHRLPINSPSAPHQLPIKTPSTQHGDPMGTPMGVPNGETDTLPITPHTGSRREAGTPDGKPTGRRWEAGWGEPNGKDGEWNGERWEQAKGRKDEELALTPLEPEPELLGLQFFCL